MKHGFILGVNQPLCLGLVADAKTLALVGVGVEIVKCIATAAIN
jgi:hypothetical protein